MEYLSIGAKAAKCICTDIVFSGADTVTDVLTADEYYK